MALTLLWSETTYDQAAWDLQAAWSAWAAASCVERHRDHLWYLHLDHPDDDSRISIACDYCHTSGYDVWNDFAEYLEGELDGAKAFIAFAVIVVCILLVCSVWKQRHDTPTPAPSPSCAQLAYLDGHTVRIPAEEAG